MTRRFGQSDEQREWVIREQLANLQAHYIKAREPLLDELIQIERRRPKQVHNVPPADFGEIPQR